MFFLFFLLQFFSLKFSSYLNEIVQWVGSVDLVNNDEANGNVLITANDCLVKQEEEVIGGVSKLLDNSKVDAIICVAGGWAGGSSASKGLFSLLFPHGIFSQALIFVFFVDFIKNSDLMIRQSVWSSLIASKLASKFLSEEGLLTLTGAKAALSGTPGMIGYGLAKAAVHHLVQSLSEPKSGLPEGATALAILPITLDTPMNRKFMPDADFSTWTPLDFLAQTFLDWSNKKETPKSGSLVQVITENSQTKLVVQ